MKNQRFAHEFVLILLLAVAVGIIAVQSNLKFTGYVTYNEGESCGDLIINGDEVCDGTNLNEKTCVTQGFDEGPLACNVDCTFDTTACPVIEPVCGDGTKADSEECDDGNVVNEDGCSDVCVIEVVEPVCDTTHLELCNVTTCTAEIGYWYEEGCHAEVQPVCGNNIIEGSEVCDGTNLNEKTCVTQGADSGVLVCNADCTLNNAGCCIESWTCTEWTACDGGTQTKTCTDANSCGTTNNKPVVSQSCTVGEETAEEETTNEDESTNQVSVTDPASTEVTPVCMSDWQCGDWQECIEGTQARICTDTNQCGTQEGIPSTSQPCVVAETCSDKIKNQDEKGIDCGGVCKKCSFLTMVGNAVNGPVEVGKEFVLKEMFGNVTKTIISIGSIVLVVAGIVCFKIFKKRKKKQN